MKETRDGFRLECTGREFYAHAHLLCPEDDDRDPINLAYGYDGSVWLDGPPFNAQERHEIANYMIERWKRWGLGRRPAPGDEP